MRGGPLTVEDNCHPHPTTTMPPPDVTLIYAEDVVEWDAYLSRQFEGSGATIHHEQVEDMHFPLGCTRTGVFRDARVVLVILSPALVQFLDRHADESFQFMKLLKPGKTIGMVCGASRASIAGVKNVLVSYDEWRHLEAKDKDINMVRDVIEMMQETLSQSKESERINKPKYKLVPRKVQEGNSKVYVMLTKPLENNTRIRVTLEASGSREVPVKKRNPYTLVFVIPEELIHVQNMVNVHVWCEEELLGVSQVKCVSKLGELYSLLTSATSPYEFLCNTLGMGSLHEVDTQLAALFRKNLPKTGFNLLNCDGKRGKCTTKEEFPTLLHFAARYGLFQLVKDLLLCPGAQVAMTLRNARGLTPAQLANHEGHVKIASIIDEFIKSTYSPEKQDVEKLVPYRQSTSGSETTKSSSIDYYDIPAPAVPVPQPSENRITGNSINDRDSDYMKMKGAHKENIEPSNNVFSEGSEKLHSTNSTSKGTNNAERGKLSLLESQAKLIEVMEAYKKGASLTEVEKLHNEWKTFYQVSDAEAKSTLDGLRNLYAKAQKAKLSKKHSSSFSELRHFFNSKLRRKESIDSKGSLSRRSSKDSSCSDKISAESDARPVSTLSVLSNTSSSSGSSFDRLSTASAGSDSGHHSDFGDERNNKFRESRYQQQRRTANIKTPTELPLFPSKLQSLTLNSKPPAPPPRPFKPHHGSLEDCKKAEVPQYSVSKKKLKSPSFDEALKMLDYSIPNSRCATLGDFRVERKISMPTLDFFSIEDPSANYDCPPPPISCPLSIHPFPPTEPTTDYDIVPPPLPLSSPPSKDLVEQNYDIPTSMLTTVRQRSHSLSSDYDFPRSLMDNTNTRPSCNCNETAKRNNLGSVKSCCVGSKVMSFDMPSVPNIDVCVTKKTDMPSVPNIDMSFIKEKGVKSKPRSLQSQYVNVFLVPGIERDSIPEEMAPPPPILESPEEHYKMVPEPTPISAVSKR